MTPPLKRCALYTRKSSDEGLDQEYNSLHAQRDACEAYVRSQAGEGWRPIPTAYDDGGISGGTMDRPALKKLLEDVQAGRVDVVVVYKVDRLTRSLPDFARMVEVFDAKGVSFVSVTQAFNTTTSMGRLTLNVLLSFAQFEREVTGERIRDKIAQSKARGMWMGGNVLLGYDAHERTLKPNPQEAETVRRMFARYLELGSVHRLRDELEATGVRSKSGRVIDRGALFHLLTNRHYQGLILHKGTAHPGQHPAIVEPELFEAVQAQLAVNRRDRTRAKVRRDERRPLTGLIFDAKGHPMTPSATQKRGSHRYSYYVSKPLLTGTQAGSDPTLRRLPAQVVEDHLLEVLRRILEAPDEAAWADLKHLLVRVEVGSIEAVLTIGSEALRNPLDQEGSLQAVRRRLASEERAWLQEGCVRVTVPLRLLLRGGKTWEVETPAGVRPARPPRPDRALVAALRKAHKLAASRGVTPVEGAARKTEDTGERMSTYDRRLCRMAFLAPDLQAAILDGSQPRELMLAELLAGDLPPLWGEQRELLGSAQARLRA